MKIKSYNKVVGLCFLGTIIAFSLGSLLLPDKEFSSDENRILQQIPKFSFTSYFEGRFEKKAENYFNDQLAFRSVFVRVKTASDSTVGILSSNGVYNSKDNYLIEEISLPTKEQNSRLTASIKDFKERYPGTNTYFLLAPNAGNIMSNKLPLTVKLKDQNKYMDEFFEKVSSYGIKTIDVRKAFSKEKDQSQLYYKTDHHWTSRGAEIAYYESKPILGLKSDLKYEPLSVRRDFKGTLASKSGFANGENDSLEIYLPKKGQDVLPSVIFFVDDKEKTTSYYKFDNIESKDAYTVFGGWNHPFYTIKTPTKEKRNLLLIKDSYANCYIPFIMQDFRKIVVVDPRYFFGDIDQVMETEEITDVMFLYNANTLSTDNSLSQMLTH